MDREANTEKNLYEYVLTQFSACFCDNVRSHKHKATITCHTFTVGAIYLCSAFLSITVFTQRLSR